MQGLRPWAPVCAALALAGCDGASGSSTEANATNTADNSAAVADNMPSSPRASDHNYQIQEDGAYGYTTAISQDDQNAGKSSGDTIMYRYLGDRNGVYTLQDADNPEQKAECHNPCQDIKFMALGQVVSRSEFNPASVIGSAFEDAFNGKLEVYARSHKSEDDKGG